MNKLSFPIIELEGKRFMLLIDLNLYNKKSVVASCYKFSHLFFIHQQLKDNQIEVIFENKQDQHVSEEIVKQFCNELIDQQVRFNTEAQFCKIRDMIVEEAFKPLSK